VTLHGCAGDCKPFNITYNFDDEMSLDFKKKSKKFFNNNDTSLIDGSESLENIVHNYSCSLPEDPFEHILNLDYNKYLDTYI